MKTRFILIKKIFFQNINFKTLLYDSKAFLYSRLSSFGWPISLLRSKTAGMFEKSPENPRQMELLRARIHTY